MYVKIRRELLSDLIQFVRLFAEPHETDTVCEGAIKSAKEAQQFLQNENVAQVQSELDDTRKVMSELIENLDKMASDQLKRFEEVKAKCVRLKKDLRKKSSQDLEQVVMWANGAKDVQGDYGKAARHVLEMLERSKK